MISLTRRTLYSTAAALLLFSGNAFADMIQPPFFDGEIGFAGEHGSATPTGGSGVADATMVDFDNSKHIVVFGTSGDFSDIPILTPVTFHDFTFNPSTPAYPLWDISYDGDSYAFAVDLFDVIHQHDDSLVIEGTGYLHASGYTPTSGSWTFSLDQSGQTVFGWSSTTSIPEPGTLALLGIGLLGIALARRGTRRLAGGRA